MSERTDPGSVVEQSEQARPACESCAAAQADGHSRREFLAGVAQTILGVTVVGVAVPILDACSTGGLGGSPTSLKNLPNAFDVSALTQPGQALVTKTVGPDGAPIVIILKSAGNYLALSMRCTHQGCTIFPPQNGYMVCPCHGSVYDMNGNLVQGFGRGPLYRYTSSFDASTHTLTLNFG